jgi:long-chain acyl-CoA synthetase
VRLVTDGLLHTALLSTAARHADRTAIVGAERRVTFGDLSETAQRTCGWLLEQGVEPGDRVAIVAENSPEYLATALGTWMAGAVLATAYPSSAQSEFEYVFDNARPRVVLADAARLAAVTELYRDTDSLVHLLGDTAGSAGKALPGIRPGDPALICYTSGTSARPKPVMHSQAGLLAGAETYADVWHLQPGDKTLVCLPMAWLYGLVTASIVTLLGGGAVIVLPRFNPVHVMHAIEIEGVTVFPGVATMFSKLIRYADEAQRAFELSSLRFCVAGGGPRNEPVFARWRELSGVPVHDTYCASECFPVFTYDPVADPEPRAGSAGRLVPGAEMRVLDSEGRPAANGHSGEAYWRGPGTMLGYHGEPELTRAAMTNDGWYRTGDLVESDADGYVYVVGRVSDLIIRGGSNVSPAEVEAEIALHPKVVDVAVVGLPDPEYGELVAAAIVPEPAQSLDAQELGRFLAPRLAGYKVPTRVAVVEEIPRNASGKIVRRAVAEQLA